MNLPAPPRLALALGLLSAGLIALQLALMQLLSISQWHHFAYLVISVALLGFGASGTVLALFRDRLLGNISILMPALTLACAATVAAQMSLVRTLGGGFDSYLLFTDIGQIARLLLYSLLIALPFFLGALALGLVFVSQTEKIGLFYFANLIGSGAGALGGLALLTLMAPERLPGAVALPILMAGLLLVMRPAGGVVKALTVFAAVAITAFLARPPEPRLSPYKDLRQSLNLPEARIVATQNAPTGQVTAVASPSLRFAPGASLVYTGEIPGGDVLFNNGNWFGFVPREPPLAGAVLDATTQGLPYALAKPHSVLILQAGSGTQIAQALRHGAGEVVAVEPHRAALELIRQSYPITAAATFDHRAVRIQAIEPRTFLAATEKRFDLIVLPTVGAFGGTAGLFALQEQYLLTREAFTEMWHRLDADGWLSVTVWLDSPPRTPLRLAATLAEAAEAAGFNATDHLLAVRSWGALTLCLKKSPLSASDVSNLRAFAKKRLFDPAVLPGLTTAERARFNQLQDDDFFALLDGTLSANRGELYNAYPFRLRPTNDDRPFFSQQLSWHSLPELERYFGKRTIPFLEIGYLVVLLTFVLVSSAAVVLIVLPLLRLGWRRGARSAVLLFFGGLGIGYMLFEMVLIHRFVLFLGHPVYAAAAVISILLIFSGAGSYFSVRLAERRRAPQALAAIVSLLIGLYALLLPPLLERTVSLSLPIKSVLTLVLLAPPAVAMGFPFPLGVQQLGRSRAADVPWAWGINGCLSVVSTALATIIAVEAGFTNVFFLSACAYLVAAASRLPE